jgi:hypothetical protein
MLFDNNVQEAKRAIAEIITISELAGGAILPSSVER